MILRDCIKYGAGVLREAGIAECENDARLLAMYTFNLDYTGMLMRSSEELLQDDINAYLNVIEKRATHYPCQYIMGTQEFMGYTFKVNESVLVPRQETELLVEKALELTGELETCRALDMCCGSGCIGVSYSLFRRAKGHERDSVTLADISAKALEVAQANNMLHNANCSVVETDLFEKTDGKYDIILSNPPYIKSADIDGLMEEVRCYEPRLALDGCEDGLYFYDRIIKEAGEYLNENGKLLFEIGCDQYESVRGLLVGQGYENIELIKDYAGLDRVVSCSYTGRG